MQEQDGSSHKEQLKMVSDTKIHSIIPSKSQLKIECHQLPEICQL